jgi:xanthine dehydrogenase molybdopterin-binding subunit B
MESISKSVKKKDHEPKINGSALYVDDLVMDGMLYGRLLRSAKAKAVIKDILIPDLPEGYYIVDKNDVTGTNEVHIVLDDTPVFADGKVEFIGDPILMIIGPDLKEVEKIRNSISVIYEEQIPVLDVSKSDTVFFHYTYEKGNIDKVKEEADYILTETFQTGYQEQAYLETHVSLLTRTMGG